MKTLSKGVGKLPLAVPVILGLAQLGKQAVHDHNDAPNPLRLSSHSPGLCSLAMCESGTLYDPVSKDDPFILENPALSDQISSMCCAAFADRW